MNQAQTLQDIYSKIADIQDALCAGISPKKILYPQNLNVIALQLNAQTSIQIGIPLINQKAIHSVAVSITFDSYRGHRRSTPKILNSLEASITSKIQSGYTPIEPLAFEENLILLNPFASELALFFSDSCKTAKYRLIYTDI